MTLRSPLASVRDHRTLFTEDELRGAYSLVIDEELAAGGKSDGVLSNKRGGRTK